MEEEEERLDPVLAARVAYLYEDGPLPVGSPHLESIKQLTTEFPHLPYMWEFGVPFHNNVQLDREYTSLMCLNISESDTFQTIDILRYSDVMVERHDFGSFSSLSKMREALSKLQAEEVIRLSGVSQKLKSVIKPRKKELTNITKR